MKRRTKILIGVAAVVVIAVVIAAVVASSRNKGIRVRTTKVDRKDLVQLVTANGTVQAKTKVELSANIMGQITKLNAEEGDPVKKGDLLLVIDQARYASAVASSRAAFESLEAELVRVREAAAQAKRDRDRAQAQYRDGILATADLDRAISSYDQAVAAVTRAERQVEQARADIASAQDALEKTEIRAPMDGIVTRRNIEQGEVVVTGTMNNPGTVLMTISDMSTIEAVLEVDQTDVPQLRIGQKASIRIDAFPDAPFPGEVSEIGSSPIRGTSALGGAATGTDYEVKVTLLKHPERIRPGLTVTTDITTATRDKVLTVPVGALVLRPPEPKGTPGTAKGKPTPGGAAPTPASGPAKGEPVGSRPKDIEGVYVVAAKKAEFRPVTAGIKGEMDVEVTSGLKEGDEVVVGPFKALRDLKPGAQVVVDNTERAGLER
ncbi:MAG: efflux RND transporter periplasmic adaptor subunit [Thermoanaerobaculaceae bacterium]|nr:efflux RND transporter periplasmic adaptor subunit [Thermoanaerobaculaceae bacterium]